MRAIAEYTDFTKSLLPLDRMRSVLADRAAASFAAAQPYPHIVFDDFFDPAILDRILDEFPAKDQIDWQKFSGKYEVKLGSKSEAALGYFTRYFIYHLNSSTFLNFLEELTGMAGLIPDPHLNGGGLHQIVRCGKLGIHVDFNRQDRLKLDRRLNLLVYLNKDWLEEYGGFLELWDRDMKGCARRVLPVFNRVVLFSTTDFSYHGHPEPLACPEGRTRKSIALYYYSNGRPTHEVTGSHSTLFRDRPTDGRLAGAPETDHPVRDMVKRFVPPILLDVRRALKRRVSRRPPTTV